MVTRLNTKQIIVFFIALVLILGLYAAVRLAGQEQELRKKAATSNAQVSLQLIPREQTLAVGETKEFELRAAFTGAEVNESLDYFRTEFNFSTSYLDIPPDTYIDVSQSGFARIFRVDGPIAANASGKVVIELGASVPGNGPLIYNQSGTPVVLTIAKINFRGKAVTPGYQPLNFLIPQINSQVVNNQSVYLVPQYSNGTYQVTTAAVTPNPTAGPSITPVPLPREVQVSVFLTNSDYTKYHVRVSWAIPNTGIYTTCWESPAFGVVNMGNCPANFYDGSSYEFRADGLDINGEILNPVLTDWKVVALNSSVTNVALNLTFPIGPSITPAITPPPLPTIEPSVTPGNLVCPLPCSVGTPYTRAQGNANCDSAPDLIDFGIWLDQFSKYVNGQTIAAASRTADFNCNPTDVSTQEVGLNDFGIWLYYFSQYVNAQTLSPAERLVWQMSSEDITMQKTSSFLKRDSVVWI